MMQLNVFSDNRLLGCLAHEPTSNLFSFTYAPEWLAAEDRSALSPLLPLVPVASTTAEVHSAVVRQFFENLLPEGRALDEAASANKLSKANLVGLMLALGGETAGALRIRMAKLNEEEPSVKRLLTTAELSSRLGLRPEQAFSVWDGKVRLSIAGYQDKLAVFKENNAWFLVEGRDLASTVILKPAPVKASWTDLPDNEFFCMRLAKKVGLPTAEVRLIHVPEAVLEVDRFDRVVEDSRVRRIAVIDACQALGLAVTFKYERPFGDGKDVEHIRDGASLPKVFKFLENGQKPALERMHMLRWVLFQILIGNTDAHAKNISFFSTPTGFTTTPAYDLVSTLAYDEASLDESFAMSIGDAFKKEQLTAFEWAQFAFQCELSPKLVAAEMKKLIKKIRQDLPIVTQEVLEDGANENTVVRITRVIHRMCDQHMDLADNINRIDVKLF